MNKNEKGFGLIEIIIVVVVIGLIGAIGWFVYDRQSNKNNSESNNQTSQNVKKAENTTNPKATLNPGWNRYESSAQKISFEYPEGWFAKENKELTESESQAGESTRFYISNHQGEFTIDNFPADYQLIWLSNWYQESSVDEENKIKDCITKTCVDFTGPVQPSVIKAGSISINTYEYNTYGGLTLDAYWKVDNKRFSGHIGRGGTEAIEKLKKILSTVNHF